ncbi:MAG: hypothetical protein M3P94_03670 [Chloroflexota bacterium]|nr:hypothetical protein [Chloroflexota bacterium]
MSPPTSAAANDEARQPHENQANPDEHVPGTGIFGDETEVETLPGAGVPGIAPGATPASDAEAPTPGSVAPDDRRVAPVEGREAG